jgi:hypothetical protein
MVAPYDLVRSANRGADGARFAKEMLPVNEKPKLSRRSVFRAAAVVAGAVVTGNLLTVRPAYAQKASKQAMKYQDKPNGDQKCSNCLQFVAPNSCKVVDGTISPDGYCIAWAKKA